MNVTPGFFPVNVTPGFFQVNVIPGFVAVNEMVSNPTAAIDSDADALMLADSL